MDAAKTQTSTGERPGEIAHKPARERRATIARSDLRLLAAAWQLEQRIEELSCRIDQIQAPRWRQ
jgi:hypothetical protein